MVTIALPEVDGKRRRRYAYAKTKTAAAQLLHKLRSDLTIAGEIPSDRTSLELYLRRWLDGLEVRPTTRRSYTVVVEKHLIPALGNLFLDEITLDDLEQFSAKQRRNGVGDRTRQLTHAVLRAAMKRAVRGRVLAASPMDGLSAPRYESPEMTPWTADEARRVVAAARTDRLGAVYIVALRLGLQFPGEILGLQWGDVDLKVGEIYLTRQLNKGGAADRAPTKTRARRRRLSLPKSVVAALASHKIGMQDEGLDTPWVFPNERGGAVDPSNFVRSSFEKVVERAGVRRIRPYDMRHTFATLALQANVPVKIVSEILGHSTIKLTLQTYSHVMPGMQREAIEKLDELWGEGP